MFDTLLSAVAIICLLAGIAGFFSARTPGARGGTFAVAAFLACIFGALAVTYTLGANEVGIPVTRGKIGTPQGPGGWHTKAPWTSVEKLTVLPYTADPIDINLRNKDGGEFAARFIPRWHTDRDHAVDLYRQTRTDDEAEITRRIVDPLLGGVASDVAKTLRNDNVMDKDDPTKIAEEGIASMSTLTFGERVKTSLAPRLLAKGIVLDEVTISGDFALSDAMRTQLANLSAAKARTLVALQDEQTATAEKAAATTRAGAASQVPVLNPQQVEAYCAQLWAAEMRRATEKGVPVYTTPCGMTPGAGVLVGAK